MIRVELPLNNEFNNGSILVMILVQLSQACTIFGHFNTLCS